MEINREYEINPRSIAVIGGGSWGTALTLLLSGNLEEVGWWVRSPDTIEHIQKYRRNPNYLHYAELPVNRLKMTSDMKAAIEQADVLVFAIPAAFIKASMEANNIQSLENKYIISAIKGIVPETKMVISEFFETHYGVKHQNIAFIAGPCHSEEVAMQKLSYLTLSGDYKESLGKLAPLFEAWYLKISITNDLWGTEYAAVMKNVIAMAAGIASGLNYGDNFVAVLISNAVQEMKLMLTALSPVKRDIAASVYLGDVIVTSYSQFSRNRLFGTLLGKGYSLKATMAEMNMVAEGYYAVKSLKHISDRLEVEMPVMNAVYNVCYNGMSPFAEFRNLSAKLR